MDDLEHGLRLHVGLDGLVYLAVGSEPGVCTGLDVSAFALSDYWALLDGARSCRVLGAVQNAALLVRLLVERTRWQRLRVWLGNPLVAARGIGGIGALAAMLAPSTRRHWHLASGVDACTCTLALGLAQSTGFGPRLGELFSAHPASVPLTFLPGVNRRAAAVLLCRIGDPRWYRCPPRHDRLGPLLRHLQLTPQTARAYLLDAAPAPVIAIWHNYGRRRGSIDAPGNFLWRCLERGERGRVAAILRATTRFLRFVLAYWLAAIEKHPEFRFRAADFFDQDEAAAFFAHETVQRSSSDRE